MKKQSTLAKSVLVLAVFLLIIAGSFFSGFNALSASLSEDVSVPAADPANNPVEAKVAATQQTSSKEEQAAKQTYIVESGQTLWEIAQENGVTVQTLMKANKLSSSIIIEGQELVIQ